MLYDAEIDNAFNFHTRPKKPNSSVGWPRVTTGHRMKENVASILILFADVVKDYWSARLHKQLS